MTIKVGNSLYDASGDKQKKRLTQVLLPGVTVTQKST